jgi:TRAP transporter TAXI family solute receptor
MGWLDRRSRWRMVTLAMSVCALALSQSERAQSAGTAQMFRIATASKDGTFFPIGTLIARGISGSDACDSAPPCGVDGLISLAQVSNGSVANVKAVAAGSIEAGLAQADVVYWAFNGSGRFAGDAPLTDLRAVANLFPGSLHIVASVDSGIDQVDDLKGHRVALDEQGSGTLATAEAIIASVGISKSDLQPFYIKHHHAGPMLADGKLDAFFFVAGYPTRSVLEVSKTAKIRLVPLSERTIQSLVSARPYFAPGVIPAGAYPGHEMDTATLDIGTQLIVNTTLDEELVYDVTAALWSERTRALLDAGHPKGKQVRLDSALRGTAIPLHPGAERFYREAGVLTD